VILVGNQIDLRDGETVGVNLEESIMPIMLTFREVETCVECSAKTLQNLAEVCVCSCLD
jgi:Ras family protein T1